MVYDENMSYMSDFQDSAEPSTVQHGPEVALNIDPANAARLLINITETTSSILMLLSENDQLDTLASEVDYNPLS